MIPILSDAKLPPGYASNAVNTKLVSGNIEPYFDIGNPFTLAKAAPILTVEKMANGDWLQFRQAELASFAQDIRAVPGIVPSDPTDRRYITGFNSPIVGSVPQFTNSFLATDPSNQGANPAGAYPYITYPLGIANPVSSKAPTVSTPSPSPIVDDYNFAQEASVNEYAINSGGANYKVGDKLLLVGGTLVTGFTAATGAAQIIVLTVNPATGAILTSSLVRGGFYTTGNGPPSSTTTTGGSGTGATVNAVVNVANNFNGFSQYNVDNSAGYFIKWQIGGGGDYAPNQWMVSTAQGDLSVSYSNEAFGLIGASSWIFQVDTQSDNNPDLVVFLTGTYNGTNALDGPAVVLSFHDSTFALYSSTIGTNGNTVGGTIVAQNSYAPNYAVKYRVRVTAVSQSAASVKGFNVTVTLADATVPGTILQTLQGFIPFTGDQFGVGSNHRGSFGGANIASFENIYVQVTSPASNITVESTNYVYTYVQQFPSDPLTQESGPSDPSPTIDVFIDGTTDPATRSPVTIAIPAVPSGQHIGYIELYRLVEDAAGDETYTFVTELTAFNLTSVTGTFTPGETVTGGTSGSTATVISYGSGVLELSDVSDIFTVGETLTGGTSGAHGVYASVALSTTAITYVDSAQDSAIGPDVLITQLWAPPPATGQGILALANGMMVMFFGNVVCYCVPGFPHAWPIENQYAIDTQVVGLGGIDTTTLIVSQAYPYTAFGTDPSSLSMTKEVSIQGCTDTRSIATHKEFGVIFASGNALCYYKGQGLLNLIRIGPTGQPPFSYEQWQALAPGSIHGILHDDYYFFWYNTGSVRSGFVLDLTPNGFGLIKLDVSVTEAYVDKATDTLYLIPDFSVYPVNGAVVTTALNVISQWEAAATYRTRVWGRYDILYGYEVAHSKARVQSAPNGGTVSLKITTETGTPYNAAVPGQVAFTIGGSKFPGFIWSHELTMTGGAVVKVSSMAEAIEELDHQATG